MNPLVAERLVQEKAKTAAMKDRAAEHMKLFPYELEPVQSIQAKVVETKMNKFIDISFPPENSSAFW